MKSKFSPYLVTNYMFAPSYYKSFIISMFPFNAAKWIGVNPYSFALLIQAFTLD